MQTLTKKIISASVVVAGLGFVAAPQAQAAVFDSMPFDEFFFEGGTLTTTNFTATGVSTTAGIQPNWNAGLEEFNEYAAGVSFLGIPTLAPGSYTFAYTMTSANPIFEASASLIPMPTATTVGTLTKEIFDFEGGTLLGTATVDQNGTISTSVPTELSSYATSFYVVDTLDITAGGAIGIGNDFEAVPEPLTMLGASAAVAFGAAFKRRNANKG